MVLRPSKAGGPEKNRNGILSVLSKLPIMLQSSPRLSIFERKCSKLCGGGGEAVTILVVRGGPVGARILKINSILFTDPVVEYC